MCTTTVNTQLHNFTGLTGFKIISDERIGNLKVCATVIFTAASAEQSFSIFISVLKRMYQQLILKKLLKNLYIIIYFKIIFLKYLIEYFIKKDSKLPSIPMFGYATGLKIFKKIKNIT